MVSRFVTDVVTVFATWPSPLSAPVEPAGTTGAAERPAQPASIARTHAAESTDVESETLGTGGILLGGHADQAASQNAKRYVSEV